MSDQKRRPKPQEQAPAANLPEESAAKPLAQKLDETRGEFKKLFDEFEAQTLKTTLSNDSTLFVSGLNLQGGE